MFQSILISYEKRKTASNNKPEIRKDIIACELKKRLKENKIFDFNSTCEKFFLFVCLFARLEEKTLMCGKSFVKYNEGKLKCNGVFMVKNCMLHH